MDLPDTYKHRTVTTGWRDAYRQLLSMDDDDLLAVLHQLNAVSERREPQLERVNFIWVPRGDHEMSVGGVVKVRNTWLVLTRRVRGDEGVWNCRRMIAAPSNPIFAAWPAPTPESQGA
jgi:hypothetical protein